MRTPLHRRRSRREIGLDRGRELASSVSGTLRTAGGDARTNLARLAGDLEAQASPTLEKWTAAARPHLDHATTTVQERVLPEVKDKALMAAATAAAATEAVRPTVARLMDDLSERSAPAVVEARTRGTLAAAALRGEQKSPRLGMRAVLLLGAGVAVGAVAGLLARRDVGPPPSPIGTPPVPPVAVPDPVDATTETTQDGPPAPPKVAAARSI